MNPFLDLTQTLDLSKFNKKQIIEGRAAIVAQMTKLNDAEEFDQAAWDAFETRCSDIDQALTERATQETAAAERRTRLQALQRSTVPGQSHSPPGPAPRGAENRESEDRKDITLYPEYDGREYSMLRAIRCLINRERVNGYEGEISQEMARRSGNDPRGFYMPWNLQVRHNVAGRERRDFNLSAGTGLVENFTSRTMIDVLRNRMLLASLGAPLLANLVGTFDLPKKTSASSAYWVTEGTAPTESAMGTGQVQFSPSTVGCFTDITRALTKQTSYDVEQLVRMDLVDTIRVELDRVGLNGSGSGAEPEGVLQNSSVPTVALGTNGGAPTLAMIVGLETEVAADNADLGSLAYITSARGRGKLKQTPKVSSTDSVMLWGQDDLMNGYRSFATNQIPTDLTKGTADSICTAVLFGNWADAIFALWGGIDLNIDTASLSTSGGTRLVALADADFQVRRAESFSKNLDTIY